jgi:hypothetical protein
MIAVLMGCSSRVHQVDTCLVTHTSATKTCEGNR